MRSVQAGKAIRGGVPICWPWFGAKPSDTNLPGRGYGRIGLWEVAAASFVGDCAVEISLFMPSNDLRSAYGPDGARLSTRITIGDMLTVVLTTNNQSDGDIAFTEGLHTYFKVGDINHVQVVGLEGRQYVDLTNANTCSIQEGPINFKGELGRIFTPSLATCMILDPILSRQITVKKQGSRSAAVWNPCSETAAKMDDLGTAEWRYFVCVESANAVSDSVRVAPKPSHTMSVIYSAENM